MSIKYSVIIDIFDVSHGSETAMNGTSGAKAVHFKSGSAQQPAALPLHFCFAKDERELRAREVSLDSLPYAPLGRCA